MTSSELRTKIFADGADLEEVVAFAGDPLISGFTTNPTLMRKAGVADYEHFARLLLERIGDRPVSFEVISDELDPMHDEALHIAGWGRNVYVKVPVTTTSGESTAEIVRRLSSAGVKVNVTAVFTTDQIQGMLGSFSEGVPAIVSVLAGRIADTGRDPIPVLSEAIDIVSSIPSVEILWASPREALNAVQAGTIGCHIITMTPDLLAKLSLFGKDLAEFSLDTVRMFHEDAQVAGLRLRAHSRPV